MQFQHKITPFLSFESQAEEAAEFYTSVLPDSKILQKVENPATGAVMTVEFDLAGITCVALNTGQPWQFTESFSLAVSCQTQEEIDELWEKLSDGGKEVMCGWLQDRFGVFWQVVPTSIGAMIGDPASTKAGRVMQAMMQMVKLDMAALQAEYDGKR